MAKGTLEMGKSPEVENTFGKILGEERAKIVTSSLEEMIETVNGFTGKSQVSRMLHVAMDKADYLVESDQEYGSVMAEAFAETLNASEVALFSGGKVFFPSSDEDEILDFVRSLGVETSDDIKIVASDEAALEVFKVDDEGRPAEEPKYRYRFDFEEEAI